jgi:hypothetical protein
MRRTASKASDLAHGTVATVAGGRRRGEYTASGEPTSYDDALALV